jgi:Domain of unknown function (DUF1931)
MPVMGFTKFKRFCRTAGEVSVDRDDVRRYLDFVNEAVYDMLLLARASAKANVREAGPYRRGSSPPAVAAQRR